MSHLAIIWINRIAYCKIDELEDLWWNGLFYLFSRFF